MGVDPQRFISVVPLTMAVRVVRTEPPSGGRDVPLNLRARVVFSEPVNPATLNAGTLSLLQAGTRVEGEIETDVGGLGATFAPATELLPETGYALLVGDGIRDLDGSVLQSSVSVPFTTVGAGSGVALRFERQPGNGIAGMLLRAPVVVIATDAAGRPAAGFTGPVTLALGANPGAAVLHGTTGVQGQSAEFGNLRLDSPGDGYTLVATAPGMPAVTSAAFDMMPAEGLIALGTTKIFGGPPDFRIYVLRADGRGAARIEVPFWAGHPDWSPDGRQIVFARVGGGLVGWWEGDVELPEDSLYIINLDGSGLRGLNQNGVSPRWSPDGTRIVYNRSVDAQGQPDEEIHVINADGSGDRGLGQQGAGRELVRRWAPDRLHQRARAGRRPSPA